jgi:hypothetical protein
MTEGVDVIREKGVAESKTAARPSGQNQDPTRFTRNVPLSWRAFSGVAVTPAHEARCLAYEERLSTFSPSTYFAKPVSLSPLVCARFGWRNIEMDLLCCDACQAVWAVEFPPTLSAHATQCLTAMYVPQVASAHAVSCRYRAEASRFLDNRKVEDTAVGLDANTSMAQKLALPPALASVWPAEEVALLESVEPINMLKPLIAMLAKLCCKTSSSSGLVVPDSFTLSRPQNTIIGNVVLLSRLTDILTDGMGDVKEDREAFETATLLTLFGWRIMATEKTIAASKEVSCAAPNEETLETTGISESEILTCRLCHAQLPLFQQTADFDASAIQDNSRPWKRLRRGGLDPASHRHYCPYVCGPGCEKKAIPFWKALAEQVLDSKTNQQQSSSGLSVWRESDTAWRVIERILRQGLSTKRLPKNDISDGDRTKLQNF